jgi:hypothetical protein
MTVAPTPADVRQIVARTFGELSHGDEIAADLGERILVDAGSYVARSYRCEDLFAMWLVPAGLLQFYDDDGNLLCCFDLFESREPQAQARAA